MTSTDTSSIVFPPGKVISPEVTIQKSGSIYFENTFERPLPSLVEATQHRCGPISYGPINVKALIFVSSSTPLSASAIKISQLFSVNSFGDYMLQFFIHTTVEDMLKINDNKTTNEYQAYTIKFSTNELVTFPEGISLDKIKVIQTFVWNIDPTTSRGTETTVQDTTPG
ncbi:hypothetical protein F7018_09430 [Tenacibaculum aiptasiae]|uniref:Uncharacterized protein n=1 Tax=Tenacibaculum aiptasiae TaxID=426481 RepID=A0A7J5ALP2_9FLAO|nr:hypothetical protein [Tenacibaculum aiptasiae]KAB1158388.1 hypothetical protein F7018_09430 [Tenacibaculum aiptasiae]